MIAGVADGGPRVGLEDSSLQGRQPYQCAPCELDASRLPAITVEPDIGEVESGELRWPAEEAAPPHPAIVVEPELADAESGELRWPPPPPASCEAGDGAAATSEGAHCERSQHPAQPQY